MKAWEVVLTLFTLSVIYLVACLSAEYLYFHRL